MQLPGWPSPSCPRTGTGGLAPRGPARRRRGASRRLLLPDRRLPVDVAIGRRPAAGGSGTPRAASRLPRIASTSARPHRQTRATCGCSADRGTYSRSSSANSAARATIERTPACARSTRSMFGSTPRSRNATSSARRASAAARSPSRSANAARHASGTTCARGIRSRSRQRRVALDLDLRQPAFPRVDEVDDQPVPSLELGQPVGRGDRHRDQLLADRTPRARGGPGPSTPPAARSAPPRAWTDRPAGGRSRPPRPPAPCAGPDRRRSTSRSRAARAASRAAPRPASPRAPPRAAPPARGRRRGSRRRRRSGPAPPARARRASPVARARPAACANTARPISASPARISASPWRGSSRARDAGSTSIARAKCAAAVSYASASSAASPASSSASAASAPPPPAAASNRCRAISDTSPRAVCQHVGDAAVETDAAHRRELRQQRLLDEGVGERAGAVAVVTQEPGRERPLERPPAGRRRAPPRDRRPRTAGRSPRPRRACRPPRLRAGRGDAPITSRTPSGRPRRPTRRRSGTARARRTGCRPCGDTRPSRAPPERPDRARRRPARRGPVRRTRSTTTSRRRLASAADSGWARPELRLAVGGDDEQPHRAAPAEHVAEQDQARPLRPVEVVEHQHRRPLVADRAQQAATASRSRNRSSAGAGSARTVGQDPRERLLVPRRQPGRGLGRNRRQVAVQRLHPRLVRHAARPPPRARPARWRPPSPSRVASSAASRVLPMPGSPVTSRSPVPPWRTARTPRRRGAPDPRPADQR